MSGKFVLTGAKIFDGSMIHDNQGLAISEGSIFGLISPTNLPSGFEEVRLSGGLISPGFNDLQVNGGGGVLFNENPTVEAIKTICSAHMQFGTTGLLPTLITDTPEITTAAIDAGISACRENVPGFLGLHLEGPHLSMEKKGAHDPDLIRTMDDRDCDQLIAARRELPNLLVTVAPEAVSNDMIARLTKAGIVVSLGHTGASYEVAHAARRAGASCITHLYNAMSALTHREPGMIGAALSPIGFNCGLIADGYHVDPVVMSVSLAAKRGPGHIFLVSDAMSTVGSNIEEFELNGRTVFRKDGRLTLSDGTLAGANLELNTAVRYLFNSVGVAIEEALRMATLYPLQTLTGPTKQDLFVKGEPANFIRMDDDLIVQQVWHTGELMFDHEGLLQPN